MSELKPCPFCRHNDIGKRGDGDYECAYCETRNSEWNTRPIEDALRAEAAALKAKLAEKDDVIGATGRAQQSLFNECERLRAMYEGPLTDGEVYLVYCETGEDPSPIREIDAACMKVRRERGRA